MANPPYSSGIDRPERAHLGQAADDLLGDVGVGAVDVLGPGADLLLGEAVEGLAHEREVGVEVAVALDPGERRQVGGVPVGGDEGPRRRRASRGCVPKASSRPTIRAARSARASATKAQAMRASSAPVAP